MIFTLSWPHLNKLDQSIKIDNTAQHVFIYRSYYYYHALSIEINVDL